MKLADLTIGFALTGSFCTFASVLPQVQRLSSACKSVVPIMSEVSYSTDTRFGTAEHFRAELERMTGNPIIHTIREAEPIGPKNLLDALIIAPCTGNTLAKLANGVTDSTVTMAAKASLRNENPLLVAVSTNDGLGNSAKNIGILLNSKRVYFVPFTQDDPEHKHNSLVARMELILPAMEAAAEQRQIQPILYRG